MGHIINPVSYRLGVSRFWSSTWSVASASLTTTFSYLNVENIILTRLVQAVMNFLNLKLFKRGFLFLGLKTMRTNNFIYIYLQARIKAIFILYKLLQRTLQNLPIKYVKTIPKMATIKKIDFKAKVWLKNQLSIIDVLIDTRRAQKYSFGFNFIDNLSLLWKQSSVIVRSKVVARRNTYGYSRTTMVKYFGTQIVKYLLISRWLQIIKMFFLASLQRFYVFNKPTIKFLLMVYSQLSITAAFVSKYIATRLIQKYPLRKLLFTVLKQIKRAADYAYIYGFKIICNGRFERRGRATHIWKSLGKLPVSNQKIFVDYSVALPVLINSICSVRVWLTLLNAPERLFIN